MPIIYTYPDKNVLDGGEKFLISDGSDSNKTKNVTLQALKAGLNVIESILPGDGISISGTNDVTITNTGVLSLTSTNSAIVASASTGDIDITSTVYGGGPTIGHVPEGGNSATFLRGDGTWAPATGTAANPGGSATQMQYNVGGVTFGGTTGLVWDDTDNILSIATRYEGDVDGALLQKVLVKEPGGVSKGQVVYISGGTGDNPEVMLALASDPAKMPALGIMKDNTAEDAIGECITSGELTGLGTVLNPFSTGDELFVDAITAGRLVSSAPTNEDNLVQKIGKVIKGGGGGALTVLGAFRTNATPNLNEGSLFVGGATDQTETLSIGTVGTVLTSDGTTAAWETINAIAGTIDTDIIPVGTAPDTIGDSIMSQKTTGFPQEISITSPLENLNPGDVPKYPSLRLTSNSQNTAWNAGDNLGKIEFYHNEASTPTNPHISAFIDSVVSSTSQGSTATGSDLQFGTAPQGILGDALLSMSLSSIGNLEMTQSGLPADATYRAGSISVQNKGQFRLYGNLPFTSNDYYSIENANGVLQIGDQAGFAGSIKFFVDQEEALEINDSAESTFKGGDTTIEENLTVNKGATVEGHFTLPQVSVVPSGGSAVCDLRNGNQFRIAAMNSNTTISFANAVSGDEMTLGVTRSQNGASATITWNGVEWPDGINPDETTSQNKLDIYKFVKVDSTIFGYVAGLNYTLGS